ncbi:Kelch repeat-containing protein [Ferrimonas lipolytica]|uniref:Galactose oxidase n=1 Tax=Ferrimonas lipolytica TaxID=2724191 RepID=A0A6H1UCE4_9GAMM|nr:galactose oxidase [Ferrimonas lipolytica]QIZ76714.1 galactose oxidase [Ferrimonas lipolytica]
MKRISLAALLPLAATATTLPPLPQAVSNNAVASVIVDGQQHLLSFNGIGAGKTDKDVHANGFGLIVGQNEWQALPPLPGSQQGRLASVAVGIGEFAYLFGGYTVEPDHSEVSLPDVFRYHPGIGKFQRLASMPVPVDDAVAIPFSNRYIYLISGWHNDGNVNLVQLYDTENDSWQQASPFPGLPIFGGSGAIIGQSMVVCDGVKVDYHPERRRSFSDEAACYKGVINGDDPRRIDWRTIAHPDGDSHYRMAAIASPDNTELWFIGGSDNPYNYNGIGYNKVPAQPSARVARYQLDNNQWLLSSSAEAVMDLRGAVVVNQQVYFLGGMLADQIVTNRVSKLSILAE